MHHDIPIVYPKKHLGHPDFYSEEESVPTQTQYIPRVYPNRILSSNFRCGTWPIQNPFPLQHGDFPQRRWHLQGRRARLLRRLRQRVVDGALSAPFRLLGEDREDFFSKGGVGETLTGPDFCQFQDSLENLEETGMWHSGQSGQTCKTSCDTYTKQILRKQRIVMRE